MNWRLFILGFLWVSSLVTTHLSLAGDEFALTVKGTSNIRKTRSFQMMWREYENRFSENREPVKTDRYPTLIRVLQEAVQRLLKAQIEVLEEEVNGPRIASAKAFIKIIDDPVPNASINIIHDKTVSSGFFGSKTLPGVEALQDASETSGYNSVINDVQITTGLIRLLVQKTENVELLVGVIAHEFGHAAEYVSFERSIRKRGKVNDNKASNANAMQAREFSADYFGIEITKRALFSPDRLHRGLEIIKEFKQGNENGSTSFNVAMGAISTHPEDHLRNTANRVHLTLDRYKNGWPTPVPLKNSVDQSELLLPGEDGVFDVNVASTFSNIEEGINFLEQSMTLWEGADKNSKNYRTQENLRIYNLAWTRLDALMLKLKGVILTSEMLEKYAKISAALLQDGNSYVRYMKRPMLFEELSIDGKTYPVLERRKTLVGRDPFFKSDAYQDALRKAWGKMQLDEKRHRPTTIDEISRYLKTFYQVLPTGFVAPFFFSLPDAKLSNKERRSQSWADSDDAAFLNDSLLKPQHHRDRIFTLNQILQQAGFDPSERKPIFFLLATATAGSLSPILKQRSRNIIELSWETQKTVQELFRRVWKNKADFAISELFLENNETLDWNAIFKANGVSPVEGIKQLQADIQSVFVGTEGEDWSYFFRKLKTGHSELFKNASFALANINDASRPKSPIWLTAEMVPYIKGAKLRSGQRVDQSSLSETLGVRNYSLNPQQFRKDFKSKIVSFSKSLGSKSTFSDVVKMVQATFDDLVTHDKGRPNYIAFGARHFSESNLYKFLPAVDDLVVDAILESSLSKESQLKIMSELIEEGWDLAEESWADGKWKHLDLFRPDHPFEVYSKAKILGFDPTSWKFVIPTEPPIRRKFLSRPESVEVLDDVLNQIIELYKKNPELGKTRFQSFVKSVWETENKFKLSNIQFSHWKKFKLKVLTTIREFPFSLAEKLDGFSRLSTDGALSEIDDAVLSVSQSTKVSATDFLQFIHSSSNESRELRKGRFSSPKKHIQWVGLFVDLWSKGEEIAPDSLTQISNLVTDLFPDSSLSRDKLLEHIAWRSPLARSKDLEPLEKLKTYSEIFGAKPEMARVSSAISTYVQSLGPIEVKGLISHIRHHVGEPLSPELRALMRGSLLGNIALQRKVYEVLIKAYEWFNVGDEVSPQELTDLILDWFDQMLMGMTGSERIPMIDLLIHSGSKPIYGQDSWEFVFAREFLGYKAGTDNEKVLRAFLNASPQYERSIALSYLTSLDPSQQVGDDIKPIFEVFQTPGKKAAQAVDTWKLLGERSSELKSFKSSKEFAMTKYRLLVILENEYGKKFSGTRVERILGSASMKTVVEASRGKRSTAFSVIDPNSRDQSISHLEFAKRFLKALETEGLAGEAHLMENLVSSLQRQLEIESDTKNEVSGMKLAAAAIRKILKKRGGKIEGWSVTVPEVDAEYGVTQHAIAMSIVRGEFFEELTPPDQETGGKALFAVMLDLLFDEGLWDADRHGGNTLFHSTGAMMTLLDWGQFEQFSKKPLWLPDDRTKIAEFLYSLSLRDGMYSAIVISKMSDGSHSDEQIRRFGEQIQSLYSRHLSAQMEMIELFKLAQKEGFAIKDKFGVGFIKGLLTLGGEQYVHVEFMKKMLGDAVAEHLKSKGLFGFISKYESTRLKNPSWGRLKCARKIIGDL